MTKMFALETLDNVLTMSSLAIAELTGKRHDTVLKDIKGMFDELGEDARKFEGGYKDPIGRILPCYNLPHKLAMALVGRHGYNFSKYGYNFSVSIFDKLEDELHKVIQALTEFEIPEDIPGMYVYAIKEMDTGNIKLGLSDNPVRRLEQLQSRNSSRLKLVGYKKADNGLKDEC